MAEVPNNRQEQEAIARLHASEFSQKLELTQFDIGVIESLEPEDLGWGQVLQKMSVPFRQGFTLSDEEAFFKNIEQQLLTRLAWEFAIVKKRTVLGTVQTIPYQTGSTNQGMMRRFLSTQYELYQAEDLQALLQTSQKEHEEIQAKQTENETEAFIQLLELAKRIERSLLGSARDIGGFNPLEKFQEKIKEELQEKLKGLVKRKKEDYIEHTIRQTSFEILKDLWNSEALTQENIQKAEENYRKKLTLEIEKAKREGRSFRFDGDLQAFYYALKNQISEAQAFPRTLERIEKLLLLQEDAQRTLAASYNSQLGGDPPKFYLQIKTALVEIKKSLDDNVEAFFHDCSEKARNNQEENEAEVKIAQEALQGVRALIPKEYSIHDPDTGIRCLARVRDNVQAEKAIEILEKNPAFSKISFVQWIVAEKSAKTFQSLEQQREKIHEKIKEIHEKERVEALRHAVKKSRVAWVQHWRLQKDGNDYSVESMSSIFTKFSSDEDNPPREFSFSRGTKQKSKASVVSMVELLQQHLKKGIVDEKVLVFVCDCLGTSWFRKVLKHNRDDKEIQAFSSVFGEMQKMVFLNYDAIFRNTAAVTNSLDDLTQQVNRVVERIKTILLSLDNNDTLVMMAALYANMADEAYQKQNYALCRAINNAFLDTEVFKRFKQISGSNGTNTLGILSELLGEPEI